jgi:hypothetical protein
VGELPERQVVAEMARCWRIEGYEREDVIQEIYLALLLEEDVKRHLELLKKREYRRKGREATRPLNEEDPAWLAVNDVRTLTGHDIPSLVLRLACEHECRNEKDRTLLRDITTGARYSDIAAGYNLNYDAARKRIVRFRKYLFPRIYEEGIID